MIFRATVLLLLATLSACGFQLRGTISIPPEWQTLELNTPSPNSELASGVRSGFSNNGVTWAEVPEANYVLILGPEVFEQRNLTIGSNARATEFELTLKTNLEVRSAKGDQIAEPTDVVVTKIMTHDPENVTGKVEESRLLRQEMRVELVQQVMRRVRFLSTSGVASTSP